MEESIYFQANDLMLGDWIKIGKVPLRVIQLTHFAHKDDSVVLETGSEYLDVEPIPLTAEILEKNGFEVHRQFATFTEYWLDIPRKLVRVAPNSYIEIYNGENKNVHIDGKSYVHELQHALRLCGIDKTIEL